MKDSDCGRWTIELSLSHHDNSYYSVDWFKGEDETIERASNAKSEEEADAILRAAYKGPDVDGVTCKWFILRNLHHPEFWRFGRITSRPPMAGEPRPRPTGTSLT